jgi:serine/threonine protein kinase/Tol biopolymer transport system component
MSEAEGKVEAAPASTGWFGAMSADPTVSAVGRIVGPYRLEEEIGRGGMGVVYRATRLDTGETVALKLMLPEIAANSHFRARFVREASLGSGLDHPNIVPIYDAGETDGELFIAMRLVAGRDLKEVLEQEGRFDPKRLLAILRQVGGALDAAHESGVVHHDIKPQNILVSDAKGDGDHDLVFVTDFGLVKPAGSESTNSRTGAQVFGSIQYMPPEQVEGLPSDGRADVYALGCVIFECLTGQIPFDRPNEVAVLWAHVHEEPSRVSDLCPSLPGGLDVVVATAMAKRPDDRFLTCGELVEAFENGMQRAHRSTLMPIVRPLVKRVPRRKTESEVWAPNYFPELSRVRKLTDRTNWIQVIAVTAVLSLLAAAFVQFSYGGGISQAAADAVGVVRRSIDGAGDALGSALVPFESDEVAGTVEGKSAGDGANGLVDHRSTHQRRAARLDQEQGRESSRVSTAPSLTDRGAVRSDGFVAFVSTRDGSHDIWTANDRGEELSQLTEGATVDLDPAISPDGSRIVFSRGLGVQVPCTTVMGQRHCSGSTGHLWTMDSDGSDLTQITFGAGIYDAQPDWAPDGQSIVFTRWEANRNPKIYILELNKSELSPRLLVATPDGEMEPSFSPGGRRVAYTFFRDSDDMWDPNDDHTTQLAIAELSVGAGSITVLAISDPNLGGGGESTPAWSPNGRDIVFARPASRWLSAGVWMWSCSNTRCGGSAAYADPLTNGQDWAPTWSPDGARLAFQRCGGGEEKCRVLTVGSAGGIRTLIDRAGSFDGLPDWWGPSS